MSGSSSPLPPPRDHALDDDVSAGAGPTTLLGRPPATASLRSRITELLARVPVSPGRLLVIAGAVVGAAVLGLWLLRAPPPAVETTLPRADPSLNASAAAPGTASTPPTRRTTVIVDAAGSVRRPGLYRLAPGARVDDLIRAAGGLRAGADPERLNLAAPLADGQRVYVPKVGQSMLPAPVDPTGGGSAGDPGQTTPSTGPAGPGGSGPAGPQAPIDLNSATSDQLDTLPGVGPTTAAAILAYRSEHGPFRSVDELLDVRGIGDAKLAALRARVRV
jgi:competence protein ComEA